MTGQRCAAPKFGVGEHARSVLNPPRHAGAMRKHRTRNLEIPGLVLPDHPGMTASENPTHAYLATGRMVKAARLFAWRRSRWSRPLGRARRPDRRRRQERL